MTANIPFLSSTMEIVPAWIDYNNHLNMAYYHVLLDRGADQAFALMGIDETYTATRGFTSYAAEYRLQYRRELHLGDTVRVGFQLLEVDDKRFHFCQWLLHQDGWVAAQGEGVGLHIDPNGPRVVPFPADIAAKVAALQAKHASHPIPDFVGRRIGLTGNDK